MRKKGSYTSWKLFSLLLVCVMVLLSSSSVMAIEIPDLTKKGELSTTFQNEGTPIAGGSLTIYQVGSVHRDAVGNDTFVLTDDFSGSNLQGELSSLESTTLASAFYRYAQDNKITGTSKQIDKDGNVKFDELELGLYLVTQSQPAPGYKAIKPFLVTIPFRTESGELLYEVNATPKTDVPEKNPPTPNPPETEPPETESESETETETETESETETETETESETDETETEKPSKPDKPSKPSKPSKPDGSGDLLPDGAHKPGDGGSGDLLPDGVNRPGSDGATYGSGGSSIPQTGQLWWPVSILCIVGAFLVIIGLFFRKKEAE